MGHRLVGRPRRQSSPNPHTLAALWGVGVGCGGSTVPVGVRVHAVGGGEALT